MFLLLNNITLFMINYNIIYQHCNMLFINKHNMSLFIKKPGTKQKLSVTRILSGNLRYRYLE